MAQNDLGSGSFGGGLDDLSGEYLPGATVELESLITDFIGLESRIPDFIGLESLITDFIELI